MTMLNDSPRETKRNYGIPARTPASQALWAHLLRKDTLGPVPNSGIINPPITPLDKNGTSMRILLHDTQAHLDKFSARVETLCSGVNESKREISMVNTLFQREREALTGELVELVNRSQTQVQSSVGTPAQSDELGRLSKDLNIHLEALEKRMDSIQSFNQTHSQVLHLQSQALQSLQDQHRTVISAVMPLLPLLQAIPLHIESARNTITELMIKSATRSPESVKEALRRPNTGALTHGKKRSSSTALETDDSPSPLAPKRRRITPDNTHLVSSTMNVEPQTSKGDRPAQPTNGKVDSMDGSRQTSGSRFAMTTLPSLARSETIIVPSPPRIPLTTPGPAFRPLIQIPNAHTRSQTTTPTLKDDDRARQDEVDSGQASSSPGFLGHCRLPVRHSSRSHRATFTSSRALSTHQPARAPSLLPLAPTLTGRSPFVIPRLNSSTMRNKDDISPMQTSRLSTPSTASTKLFQSRATPLDQKKLSAMLPPGPGRPSVQSPRASTPSFSSSRVFVETTSSVVATVRDPPFPHPAQLRPMFQRGVSTVLTTPQQRSAAGATPRKPLVKPIGSEANPIIMSAPIAKVRERRSPFREGRRFIPLGDSDDENGDVEV